MTHFEVVAISVVPFSSCGVVSGYHGGYQHRPFDGQLSTLELIESYGIGLVPKLQAEQNLLPWRTCPQVQMPVSLHCRNCLPMSST